MPLRYDQWIASEEAAQLARLGRRKPGHHAIAPQRLGLVLHATEGCGPALSAIIGQCPEGCTVLVLDQGCGMAGEGSITVPADWRPEAAIGLALEHLDADLLCFHDLRDQLAPDALALVMGALARDPQTDLLFADEDWLEDGDRVRPFFKGGWDPEWQRGRDLIGPFAAFRTALVRQAARPTGPAWRYDLANQVAAATRPDHIQHIPAVLCHRVSTNPADSDALRDAAAVQLRRDGVSGHVEPAPGQGHRVVYTLPQPAPAVSVIVPTRDHPALLRSCAEGLLHGTDYPHLELLLIDNGTTDPEALVLLDQLSTDARVRLLRCPGPFNWSALNNAAADQATGQILVLLNNDITVLRPDWLTVLVSHAVQPGIGAVGAKLLYPDGRIQHAGVTTDWSGVPRHLLRFADGDGPGPFGLTATARTVWAVTGACLAIPRDVFFAVGGLNEAVLLCIAYNDVDLCLRLTASGYRIVWTPWCVLEHHELASRTPDHTPARRDQAREELDRLIRDWGRLVLHDPFLSPNLQLVDEQPEFARSAPKVA